MTDEEKLDDDINLDEFNFDDLVVDNADGDTAATGGAPAEDAFNFDDITAGDFNFDDLPGGDLPEISAESDLAGGSLSDLPEETPITVESADIPEVQISPEENALPQEDAFSVPTEEMTEMPAQDTLPVSNEPAAEGSETAAVSEPGGFGDAPVDDFAEILPENTAVPAAEESEVAVPETEASTTAEIFDEKAVEEENGRFEENADYDYAGHDENNVAEEAAAVDIPGEAEETVNDVLLNDEPAQADDADEIHDAYFANDAVKTEPEEYNRSDNVLPAGDYPVATIEESGQIGFLRWYSGSSGDQMFEIARGFESGSFNADEECKTLHVNVGYDTYGWEVQFSDGVVMNLRDVREYQIRNGRLPSAEGRIIYGQSTLMFSGIERIVVYESVKYFSYGV